MNTLGQYLDAYLQRGQSLRLSALTLRGARYHVRGFIKWVETQAGVTEVDGLHTAHLEPWQKHLVGRLSQRGTPLRPRTINKQVEGVRGFLKWLASRGLVPNAFAASLVYVKEPRLLPTSVLNHRQVRELLQSVDTTSVHGHRDRTILEMLYSSGLRAAELLGLEVGDVDLVQATARVTGKGNKQRVVPIGRTALRMLESYLKAVRPFLLRGGNPTAMFLDDRGVPMPYHTLRRLVHRYADGVGGQLVVTPHTFRRSCTTELIRGGANLYHVKELLGHETLDTLQHYTRLTIEDLKKTHARCHPREREKPGLA